MNTYYTQYYLRQTGSGLSDIGTIYRSPGFQQKGRGGIGSFFSGLIKHLRPFVSSGLSALKDQSLKSGSNIIADIGKKPLSTILKEQGKAALENLTNRGLAKLKKMQKGSGRKRNIKRGRVSKNTHSFKKRSRGRKGSKKQIGQGKKRRRSNKRSKVSKRSKVNKRIKVSKNQRFVDIFDN